MITAEMQVCDTAMFDFRLTFSSGFAEFDAIGRIGHIEENLPVRLRNPEH